MPINRFLDGEVFEPADITCMTAAYEAALRLLRLSDRADPLTEIVAKKIIEVFRKGERDPLRICARAIKELGVPLPE